MLNARGLPDGGADHGAKRAGLHPAARQFTVLPDWSPPSGHFQRVAALEVIHLTSRASHHTSTHQHQNCERMELPEPEMFFPGTRLLIGPTDPLPIWKFRAEHRIPARPKAYATVLTASGGVTGMNCLPDRTTSAGSQAG